mgnify:CR=1 FL=1
MTLAPSFKLPTLLSGEQLELIHYIFHPDEPSDDEDESEEIGPKKRV